MQPLAAFTGDLERAEQLATEAVELGQRAGRPDDAVIGSFGALLFQIRTGQGRLGELVTPARGACRSGTRGLDLAIGAGRRVDRERPGRRGSGALPLARGRPLRQRAARHRVQRDDGRARAVVLCRSAGGVDLARRLRPPHAVGRVLQLERSDDRAPHRSRAGDDRGRVAAARCRRRPLRRRGGAVRAGRSAKLYLAHCRYDWAHVLADRGDTDRFPSTGRDRARARHRDRHDRPARSRPARSIALLESLR